MRLSPRLVAAACALGAAPALSHAGVVTQVDVELTLLVDVSGSISAAEFGLQRFGYASAFRSPGIKEQITSTEGGRLGRIAVNVIYWSSAHQQAEVIPWTLLDSEAACEAFADAIDASHRMFEDQTSVSGALDFARSRFATNAYEGFRKVIDISSDGENNEDPDGRTVAMARSETLAEIDTINAMVIGSESLMAYYVDNVIGGSNAFAMQTPSFLTFQDAIFQKLTFEIPTPGSLALVGLGGLALLRRRR